MTDAELQRLLDRIPEIKARIAAATPGPWTLGPTSVESKMYGTIAILWPRFIGTLHLPHWKEDAALIAYGRTDLEDLVAAVEKLARQRGRRGIGPGSYEPGRLG